MKYLFTGERTPQIPHPMYIGCNFYVKHDSLCRLEEGGSDSLRFKGGLKERTWGPASAASLDTWSRAICKTTDSSWCPILTLESLRSHSALPFHINIPLSHASSQSKSVKRDLNSQGHCYQSSWAWFVNPLWKSPHGEQSSYAAAEPTGT